MSGLTEMMEYITKYYLATRNTVKGFDDKALHILLKYSLTLRASRYKRKAQRQKLKADSRQLKA